jgi:bcr-type benzoyl-CoA reductase subunit C
MQDVEKIIAALEDIARHPARAVREALQASGRQAVGCFPYYAPEEIVYGAGFLPVGLWGGQAEIQKADMYLQSFCCSIMRENIELGLSGAYDFLAAVLMPVYCDTLKCVCENWKAAFPHQKLIPLIYPQNRGRAGKAYLLSAYRCLQSELAALSGRPVSDDDLQKSIAVYEQYRASMRQFTALVKKYPHTLNPLTRHLIIKAGYFADKKWYTEKLRRLLTGLQKRKAEKFNGKKVVITGILAEPEALLEIFRQNNISFAADDLAQESRAFRTRAAGRGSGLEKLVNRYLRQQCCLLHDPGKSRGQLLIDLAKKNKADAVVAVVLKFCDPEEFDYPLYKKELESAGVPLLYLEVEQKMDSLAQLGTRIQSFSEMLQ